MFGSSLTDMIQGAGDFGSDEDLYGRKVNVPDYPELEEAQRKAIAANKAVLPEAQDLASSVNTFNQAELERMLRLSIPDLDEINANNSSNIAAWTRGELGKGVEDLIARKSAERSVAGGFSGSGMHRNLEARDLGLNSLQMTQQGLSSAERWTASVRANQTAPMADVSSMFISPAQKFSAMEAKWQRDLYAETMAAAPDPARRGKFDSEMAIIGMVLSVYGGGQGYTGAYQGPNAAPPPNANQNGWNGNGANYLGAQPYGGPSYVGNSAGGFEGGGVSGGWSNSGGSSNLLGGGTPFV